MKKQQQKEDIVQQNQPPHQGPADIHTDEGEVWKQKYLRALADYQNLEKRIAEKYAEERLHARMEIFGKLLPVIDSLEKAETHLNDEGLMLAMRLFRSVLSHFSVEKLDVVGKPFNPHTMECVEKDRDGETVTEVIHEGYTLHGRLLRPAKVHVGTKLTGELKK